MQKPTIEATPPASIADVRQPSKHRNGWIEVNASLLSGEFVTAQVADEVD